MLFRSQIIFGDHVEKVKDRFTVLELDTFKIEGSDFRFKTWCLVESIPLTEMPLLESLKKIHQDLIDQYRQQNWGFCKNALEQLQGRFGGELDTFYSDLESRIDEYIGNPPDSTWTGELIKSLQGPVAGLEDVVDA